MDYPLSSSNAEVLQIMSVMLVVTFAVVGLILLVFYLFEAIAVYKLSKNRGYQKPWMAFIPVANAWVLGGIADNIHYCYGKTTRWRIILLVLEAFWCLSYFSYMFLMISAIPSMLHAAAVGGQTAMLANSGWVQVMAISPVVSLISLGRVVVRAIVCYKIYQDYEPKNAALFLVFSIVCGLWPFFLFALRNRISASLYWKNQPRPPYPFPPAGAPPVNPSGTYPPQQR